MRTSPLDAKRSVASRPARLSYGSQYGAYGTLAYLLDAWERVCSTKEQDSLAREGAHILEELIGGEFGAPIALSARRGRFLDTASVLA